jgi:hypothetical protein
MKLHLKTVAGLTLTALLLSSCGVFKTREKNEAAVQKVKTVAVVAFSAYQPASAHIGLNLGSGKAEGAAGGSMIPQNSEHIDQMYEDIAKAFGKNVGWNVLDVKKMMNSAAYQKAFKATMEGWQNKMPPGAGQNHFIVKNIMDFDAARILDVKGRDELLKGLGVDAIIAVRVQVDLSGTTVMGVGSRYPAAKTAFYVYEEGNAKPIWFEGNLDGETSKKSVGKTGFIDEKLLNTEALVSARTSFEKIGKSVE